jgi:hypothetical protein
MKEIRPKDPVSNVKPIAPVENVPAALPPPGTDLDGIPEALRRPIVDSTPGAAAKRYRGQISKEAQTIQQEKESKMTDELKTVDGDSGLFSRVPATAASNRQAPAHLQSRIKADKPGRGTSRDNTATFRYPLVKILQSGSPEVNKRSPDYVENATPGSFLFRTPSPFVRDGVAGVSVIVACADIVEIEWRANRQGFAALHHKRPADAFGQDTGRKVQYFRENGNEVVRTGRFFFLLEGTTYEFDVKSTAFNFFDKLNARFDYYQDDKESPYPCYARRYLLQTEPASNALGSWFAPVFKDDANDPAAWVSEEEYDAAQAISIELEEDNERRRRNLKLVSAA